MSMQDLLVYDFQVEKAVNLIIEGVLNEVEYELDEIDTFEELKERLQDKVFLYVDETNIIPLDHNTRLDLAYHYEEETGCGPGDSLKSWSDFERVLEQTAAAGLAVYAETMLWVALESIQKFLEKHDLDFKTIQFSDPGQYFPPVKIVSLENLSGCILQYRTYNDSDANMDVYHCAVVKGVDLYFVKSA